MKASQLIKELRALCETVDGDPDVILFVPSFKPGGRRNVVGVDRHEPKNLVATDLVLQISKWEPK